MRNSRALLVLALSIIAGLAAVVVAIRWIGQQGAVTTSKVVVAATDIGIGQPLTAQMVEQVAWPAGAMPAGSFTDIKLIEGRVIKSSLLRGEPILEPKLAPPGTKGGLSALIAEGRRAITVKVNEVVGVAGFALPGNYVDVLVHAQDDASNPVSKIVLEKILVLAVAQEATRDETKPKVVNAVTLEVSPNDAEKIDLARSIGQLSLVLRNQVDTVGVSSLGMHKSDLLGKAAAPLAPVVTKVVVPTKVAIKVSPKPKEPSLRPIAAAPPIDTQSRVEVIRGIQRSNADL
jgi:pilus assembly protein CpaB